MEVFRKGAGLFPDRDLHRFAGRLGEYGAVRRDGQLEIGADFRAHHAKADRSIDSVILEIDLAIVEGLDAVPEDDVDALLRREQKSVRPGYRYGGLSRAGDLLP